jgi:DNA polymerase-3 subunit gamma/tau
MVALVQGATAPTLRETAAKSEADRTNGAAAHPLMRKVLERFKGARIVEVRAPEVPAPAAAPQSDDDVGYADSEPVIDDEL